MYKNPIIHADYSDPDVIRVGEDFYMVASSFTYLPGVPILHSKDLVHWELINYAVPSLPFEHYAEPVHGSGTWAPAIRFHEGVFYVFIPLPDEGILVARSEDIRGQFRLNLLCQAKGWIDPCPLWDDDGRAYMVFAYARSRCGIKHRLSIVEIDPACTHLIGEPKLVFYDEAIAPTIEGPKLYKRDGLYYILAPAGGVATGWQAALRSDSIWGPYEYKVVMEQGKSSVNGPHQGGWVTTPDGKDWFIHFQDVIELGRITHLQPMEWQDGWPVMGIGGEPVQRHELPVRNQPHYAIAQSDDFADPRLGLQWQFQANPREDFYTLTGHSLLLHCLPTRRETYLWYAPNALTQIPQHPALEMDCKLTLHSAATGDFGSLGMIGHRYAYCALERRAHGNVLCLTTGTVTEDTYAGKAEEVITHVAPWASDTVYLKLRMEQDKTYRFFVSPDGITYTPFGDPQPLHRATWTGAKLAIWSANREGKAATGRAEYHYVHITELD